MKRMFFCFETELRLRNDGTSRMLWGVNRKSKNQWNIAIYENLNVSDLQANGEFAQIGAYMPGMAEAMGSISAGGNILLLDFFVIL